MRRTTGRNLALFVVLVAIFALQLKAEALSWDQPPDAVLHASSFTVRAGVQSPEHRFEIPVGQLKDRWIRGFEFQSCDPRQVESAHFYIDKTGQWLGTWTPGETMISFPDTVAAYLPATAKVVMDIHYAPVAQDSDDCSTIGLYFTDRRPLRPLMQVGIQTPVEIPGGSAVELKKEFTVITDSYAIALQPEMRGAGRSVEVTAVEPSGASQVLYGEQNYQKEGEASHVFGQPVFIPKGTRIIATASYRNSNPQDIADDWFRLDMSLYPRAEFHPAVYEAAAVRTVAVRHTTRATKRPIPQTVPAAAKTKKTTSKKSSKKKHTL